MPYHRSIASTRWLSFSRDCSRLRDIFLLGSRGLISAANWSRIHRKATNRDGSSSSTTLSGSVGAEVLLLQVSSASERPQSSTGPITGRVAPFGVYHPMPAGVVQGSLGSPDDADADPPKHSI